MIIHGSEVRQYLPQFLQHFSDLTADDRYNRFFNTMSVTAIRDWLLSIEDRDDEEHIFNVIEDDDNFIGISQLAIHKDTLDGDVSLSVVPEYQRTGLGFRMMHGIIAIAKEHGVVSLHFNTSSSNYGCRSLYTKLGFSSRYDPIEQCICGKLKIRNKL